MSFAYVNLLSFGIFYPPTKSEGYSFGVVRLSVHSVRPHFLSVRDHISVPIGQIYFNLGANDKYHELSISYTFGQNRPFNTCYCPCFRIGNYKAKPI